MGTNSNIDALYGNPYLSDTAKKLAFDSASVLRDYEVRQLAETARLKKLDNDLEISRVVEKDIDAYEGLATVKSGATQG